MSRALNILLMGLLLFACGSSQEDVAVEEVEVAEIDNTPIKEELYYTTGELKMEGETVNGAKHGIWTAYFENGGLWSKNEFVHGKLHGRSEVYHKNGLTYYTGQYQHGQKSGEWSFYDEQGNPVESINYDRPPDR